MKHKYLVIFPALALLLFPMTANANSSWAWLTETTPLTVLPYAIVGTLVIEILAVIFFIRPRKRLKAAAIITLANLFSFLAGYLLGAIALEGVGYTMMDVIMHTPHYIVSILYLLLTLLVEFPVVFCSLRRDTDKKALFVLFVVVSNIVTSILVSVCEGIFAPGAW
jgi:hypothetical protein